MHAHILLGSTVAIVTGLITTLILPTTITAYNQYPPALQPADEPQPTYNLPTTSTTTVGTTTPALASETATEQTAVTESEAPETERTELSAPAVPFFSQFADISKPGWQKVSCGVASLAMLITYYEPGATTADTLLDAGIAAGAYIDDAGWSHAGLIALSRPYGLDGESVSLAHLSRERAVSELRRVVGDGPVMVSVHYTFEPTNPIPHLVVVTAITGDTVHYNDPAEPQGGGQISLAHFARAWKQRYIAIRPTT